MKTTDYIARNLQGFEGDENIHRAIKKIAKQNGIKLAIETGTFLGGTTKRLLEIFPKVISFEIDVKNHQKAKAWLGEQNGLTLYNFDSSTSLLPILKEVQNEKILFFLDSHWGAKWPLLDELRQIKESGKKAWLVIHDAYNPNDLTMGYDEYNGQKLDIDYIKEGLDDLYGVGNYRYYYNDKAEGARRGVIYVVPTFTI